MMTDEQIPTLGRLGRRTLSTCLGALQNRAELLVVEFAEEKDRALKLVICGALGLFLAMMTIMLATATIIFLFPEQYRIYAALGFAVLYLAGTVAAVFIIRGLLRQAPFAESLNQLKKDAELMEALK